MKLQWIIYSLLMPLLIGCNTGAQETSPDNIKAEQVTVYRDAYGTPQVVAQSNRGVYFGFGYAVASDRLFQMEMLKRTAQGRVAEVLGPEYLELDTFLRSSYDHRSIKRQLRTLPQQQLEILQAYAQGFNTRIDELTPELMPVEFTDQGFLPEHWSAYDVAMIFVGSIAHRYSDFNSERDNLALLQSLELKHGKDVAWHIFNASKWLLDNTSPTTIPGPTVNTPHLERPSYLDELPVADNGNHVVLNETGKFQGMSTDPKNLLAMQQRIAAQGFSQNPEFTGASNYWAARNLKDASAALVNGPQFGFGVPSYVYGIGLHGGDFNVVGNTLLALPAMLFAHNNSIAWGSTAGISDQSDEYLLQLDPENPRRYHYKGGWRQLETWPEVIAVKGGSPVTVTARRSAQGMVQLYQPEKGIAWARARSWEGQELATLMAWVFLATDTTLDDAEQRIGAMSTNINMYTMGREGNLGYVHSGRYPRRASGHDSRLPGLGNGQWDWQGLRPYADNPKVQNPEQGYIANWNNRPASNWISSDLWTYTWGRADRAYLIFNALESKLNSKGEKASIEDIKQINQEITFADVNAPFLLPYLFDAWRGRQPTEPTTEALNELSNWDMQWRADSQGEYGPLQTLMERWLSGLLQHTFKDDIGEQYYYLYGATNYPNKPLGASMGTAPGTKALIRNLDRKASGQWNDDDYDFFNGKDAASVLRETFVAAIKSLASEQGSDLSKWHLTAHPMEWKPYNFRGVPQAREDAVYSQPAYMNRGSENNFFVATGSGIQGWDVIPPGQSGFQDPDGKRDENAGNQMDLYANFGYKQVPFSLWEVRKSARSEQKLLLPHIGAPIDMRDIPKLRARLTSGAISSKDLVEQSLTNIQQASDFNAFITIDADGARARADKLDEQRAKGEVLGPLHGIVLSLKDNIHLAGVANTAGTEALKNFIPTQDAGVVERLKAAGAIIIGKNNMHELAYGITSNNYTFGAVGNAYNPNYIAGGSSGGTAVAIATGMVSAGLGTDTGGSSRIPASLNGVAGFRPTTGRYPSDGLTPISNTRDTVGPMANHVADIALLDSVLSGEAIVNHDIDLSTLKLGVPRAYFYQNLEPAVANRTEAVLQALKEAGVTLVEADINNLAELNEAVGFPLVLFESKQLLAKYMSQNVPGGSLQTLIAGIRSPDVQQVMESVAGGVITEEVYRDALEKHRPLLQQAYREYFGKHEVDAIIFPTLPLTARPIEGSLETVELNGAQVPTFATYIQNTDPASNAGIPALSIPAGLSPAGLPIGIEINGPAGSDKTLLAIGIAIEELLASNVSMQTPPPELLNWPD